jgi:hypothetical protein
VAGNIDDVACNIDDVAGIVYDVAGNINDAAGNICQTLPGAVVHGPALDTAVHKPLPVVAQVTH